MFHHGRPAERNLLAADQRARLERGAGLSPAARELVGLAFRVVDQLTNELDTLHDQLAHLARRQPGCQALHALYGIGPVTAVAIWADRPTPH